MTHELNRRLDEQLDAVAPPSGLNAEDLAARGRKRLTARRSALSGGLTLGIAAVLAGAVFLSGGIGAGGNAADGGPSGDPSAPGWLPGTGPMTPPTAPRGNLPELAPTGNYRWQNDWPTETLPELGERLADAYFQYLSSQPGAELRTPIHGDPDNPSRWGVATRSDMAGYRLVDRSIVNVDADYEPVYTTPYYQDTDVNEVTFNTNGDRYGDWIKMGVYPKGSYLQGCGIVQGNMLPDAPAPFVVDCGDDYIAYPHGDPSAEPGYEVTYTRSSSSTQNGELVITVDRNATRVKDGVKDCIKTRTVVLYRSDGTALVAEADMLYHGDPGDFNGEDTPGSRDFTNADHDATPEILLGLLQAMPPVTF